MCLGDFHRAHRRREVGPRGHPIPDLEEVVPQIRLELLDPLPVHSRRALVRLDLLPCLPDRPLRDLERLARCFQRVHPTPPGNTVRLIERTPVTHDPAPSLHPHSRSFTTTTSRSASASRDGTLMPGRKNVPTIRALPLTHLPAGRKYRDTPSPVPLGRRRPGSRHLHAGHHLANKRHTRQAHPGVVLTPRFRCHLIYFRHVHSGSLAFAFPVPT